MVKGETSSETGDECPVAAARSILRRGLPQFAGFELLFRLLGLAVFIPSTAWLTSRLIAWSGSGAVSNYDLVGFFLSFKGLCYLIVVATIGFALAFFEFGGLIALAISLQRRKRIRMRQLFAFLGLAFPRLWRLSVKQFLIYLAIALPFLALAGGAYWMLPHRKRHQLLPLCEAAAVLDCSVGLHRRQPRIRLLRGAAFCALDLFGPAAALYERIAGYRVAGEYQARKNAEARDGNDVAPLASAGGTTF